MNRFAKGGLIFLAGGVTATAVIAGQTKPVEKIVTKTVKVEVPVEKIVTKTVDKEIEVPVVPDACGRALADARIWFGLYGDTLTANYYGQTKEYQKMMASWRGMLDQFNRNEGVCQ